MSRSSRQSSRVSVLDLDDATKHRRGEESVLTLSATRQRRESDDVRPALEFGRVSHLDECHTFVTIAALGGDPRPARCVEGVSIFEPGDDVIVALVGEAKAPVILGRIVDPKAPARDVRVNGRRVTVEADSELALRCASATITIRRDGSIAVRGERVTSHARGRHRIRGGSVELN